MEKARLITKNSIMGTLEAMPLDVTQAIYNTDINTGVVRSAITTLRRRGWKISYTERGCVNGVAVTIHYRP